MGVSHLPADILSACCSGRPRTAGRDYLLSQHAEESGEGANRVCHPAARLQWQYGVVCSRAQPPVASGRLLWADVQGHPCSHSTALLRCPLDAGRIQWAMHLVLHAACGMSADQASIITKHRARKTLVSAAPATRYPWERASHLGTGRGQYGQSVAGS